MRSLRVMLLCLLLLPSMAVSASNDGSRSGGNLSCATKGKTVIKRGDSDSEAIVVQADCSLKTLQVTTDTRGRSVLDAKGLAIDVIEDLPDVAVLDLANNNLSEFPHSQKATSLQRLVLNYNQFRSFRKVNVPSGVTFVDLSLNYIDSFDGLDLPSSVTELFIGGNLFTSLAPIARLKTLRTLYVHDLPIQSFQDVDFPESIELLNVMNTSLSSFDELKLPASLTRLDVANNAIKELPERLPENLISLKADFNLISSLQRFSFPKSITHLDFQENPVESIVGVSFPWALQSLKLGTTSISEFEISRDDLVTFQNLEEFSGTVSQPSCKNAKAQRVFIKQRISLCVIDSEDFTKLYGASSAKTPTPTTVTNAAAVTKGSSSWVVIVIICGTVVMVAAIAFVSYRRYRINKSRTKATFADGFFPGPTPGTTSGSHRNSFTFNSGVFNAKTTFLSTNTSNSFESSLLKYRIATSEITVDKQLAKGGYGVVYLAQYQKQLVVLKRILPEKSTDDRCLKGFLEEIKMCSTLSHPKIVRFIGVSWNTLADISAIFEHMPNGDLDGLLKRQAEKQKQGVHDFDWYQNSDELPAKAQIALDILEAIVYLHSFSSPIIHRDLKAKNVLLSKTYEAKLSDFGISREWAVDQTLTAGIGTMAWIAPEVLRGERYTEKADMYSFGVLMTELSTYQKPFEGVTNVLVVLKVTSGEEQPQLGRECPDDIRELASRCLNFRPSDRPSAMVAHYELKTLLKLHSAFEL